MTYDTDLNGLVVSMKSGLEDRNNTDLFGATESIYDLSQ